MVDEKIMVEKRNRKLLDMLIKKIESEYRNDVDFIGLTGSCKSGDFDKYSDLDLVIIKSDDSDKWFNMCFINEYDDLDVGYDFYTMDWKYIASKVGSTWASHIIDVEPVWYASEEVENRWNNLKKKAEENIEQPITKDKIESAEENLDRAKRYFTDLMISDKTDDKKTLLSEMLMELTDVICLLNNTYYTYGIKQRIQEIEKMKCPNNFSELYWNAIKADSDVDIKNYAQEVLKSTSIFFKNVKDSIVKIKLPSADSVRGSYEELVSNYKNKVRRAVENNDIQLAVLASCCIQEYIEEMTEECGMPEFNIGKYLDLYNLSKLSDGFRELEEVYLAEYKKLGIQADRRCIK